MHHLSPPCSVPAEPHGARGGWGKWNIHMELVTLLPSAFPPSGRDQRKAAGPLHINWNRCSEREALFFFIGSSGNHKANILPEDGFRGAL